MQDLVRVTAMVLATAPIGEYDRRVTLLTKERGKITAFAKGARKQTSKLLAATDLFAFGEFTLYPGRNSYTLTDVKIGAYFEELRKDFEKAYYGMFFLEVCDYYGRENNEDKELLKLLYQSLRALQSPTLPSHLVQYIFEIRALAIQGEYPGLPRKGDWLDSTSYTIDFIVTTPIEKLYTFLVSEEVLRQLKQIVELFRHKYIDRQMKSLEMLALLEE